MNNQNLKRHSNDYHHSLIEIMFYLEGEAFHKLNQLTSEKPYCIRFNNNRYQYSEIQLLFLSLSAFEHFEISKEDFVIDENYLQAHSIQVSIQDLLVYFNQLDSLFSSTIEINLTLTNSPIFQILANILDNPLLRTKSLKISLTQNQNFMLSSKYLSKLPRKYQERSNSLSLIANE
jgi:hypothetical protein